MTILSTGFRTLLAAVLVALLGSNLFGIAFDTTFGSGGKFTATFGSSGQPSSAGAEIFVQPSGRIVVVGSHTQQGMTTRTVGSVIAGVTSGGILDTTYGTSGRVLAWNPTHDIYRANSLMLADGSILVLLQAWESVSANRVVIVKLSAAGNVDPAFDPSMDLFPNQTSPVRITHGSGGKFYTVVRNGDQHYVIRLNPDGSRDTTFGPDGVRSLNLNRFSARPRVFALEELADGKLLIAGTYEAQGFEGQTFVARLNPDTTLDRSFGTQGAVRLAIPYGSVNGTKVKVQSDGKILIGGSWTFLGSTTLLVRLTARGRFDAGFGSAGFAQTSFNNWNVIYGISPAPDGSVFVAGSCGVKALPSNQRLFVMRYSSTGSTLSSLVTNFIGDREAGASDLLLQADGRLLITGFTQNPSDTFLQLGVARFNQ